jgi:hypothetical protein
MKYEVRANTDRAIHKQVSKMLIVTIALIKMLIMNNKIFILNVFTKKINAEDAVAEFMNSMEVLEDDLNAMNIAELAMLILFLLAARAAARIIDIALAAGRRIAVFTPALSAAAAVLYIANQMDLIHGRSCAARSLEFH